MSSKRLKERIPTAEPVTTGMLKNYSFICNKIGGPNTCYANIEYNQDSQVYGVVYQLKPEDFNILDRYEGNYQRVEVEIETDSKNIIAYTYISDYTDENLQVEDWYKAHIINGAKEHRLPPKYIQIIKEELNL